MHLGSNSQPWPHSPDDLWAALEAARGLLRGANANYAAWKAKFEESSWRYQSLLDASGKYLLTPADLDAEIRTAYLRLTEATQRIQEARERQNDAAALVMHLESMIHGD